MKMAELTNLVYGRWEGILLALGANPVFLKNVHGPCPFCGGKDRYIYDDKGQGRWYCQRCGHGDGFDYLKKLHGWDLSKTMEEVSAIVGTVPVVPVRQEDPERKAEYMRKTWKASRLVTPGDPVWLYLSRRCGDPTGYLEDIRFHPSLRHSDKTEHPAMVARMRSTDGKRGTGLHRTYLTENGQKAQVDPVRMSFGELGAIRLGGAGSRLGIAEGIETAICASKRFGLPVWSGICANGLSAWTPPEGCKSVMICADNDENGTGYDAALDLGKRLHRMGIVWELQMPDVVGTDWADVQMEGVA